MSQDEIKKNELKENIVDLLPHIRAGLDAYKTFEKSLQEYQKIGGDELYRKSPLMLKLLIKLFESNLEDIISNYE